MSKGTHTMLKHAIITTVVLMLCGCSSAAKKPQDANFLEVLHGKGIKKHIQQQKRHLNQLNVQLEQLDIDILLTLGKLNKLKSKVIKKALQHLELKDQLHQTELDINQKNQQLNNNLEKATQLQNQLVSILNDINHHQNTDKNNQERINNLGKEITQLHRENRVLTRSIERTLNLTAEQLLQDTSLNK